MSFWSCQAFEFIDFVRASWRISLGGENAFLVHAFNSFPWRGGSQLQFRAMRTGSRPAWNVSESRLYTYQVSPVLPLHRWMPNQSNNTCWVSVVAERAGRRRHRSMKLRNRSERIDSPKTRQPSDSTQSRSNPKMNCSALWHSGLLPPPCCLAPVLTFHLFLRSCLQHLQPDQNLILCLVSIVSSLVGCNTQLAKVSIHTNATQLLDFAVVCLQNC